MEIIWVKFKDQFPAKGNIIACHLKNGYHHFEVIDMGELEMCNMHGVNYIKEEVDKDPNWYAWAEIPSPFQQFNESWQELVKNI
jgi:hypothetical protein